MRALWLLCVATATFAFACNGGLKADDCVSSNEVCNGEDDDCDGVVDEAAEDAPIWHKDGDADGYGNDDDLLVACEAPEEYVGAAGDCNDADAAIHPDASEVCNEIDDDCDTLVDDDDSDLDPESAVHQWRDIDEDGFGDPDHEELSCEPLPEYVDNSDDCDDLDALVNPDGNEVCNGYDDDCDGDVDMDDDSLDESTTIELYEDLDEDGFGSDEIISACESFEGASDENGDCNDLDAAIHPDATEVCNDEDDDCDTLVDDDDNDLDPDSATEWHLDYDGDGYGGTTVSTFACDAPKSYVDNTDDCDDTEAGTYPGADEYCDDADNDCDGSIDESAVDAPTWYADSDGDGYGDAKVATVVCDAPKDTVADNTDCDDLDVDIHPGATEICDGIDSDCDGGEDPGIVTLVDTTGAVTDYTAIYSAGTASVPQQVTLTKGGTLTFCDGTYYAYTYESAAAPLTVIGLNGAGYTTIDSVYYNSAFYHYGYDADPAKVPLTVEGLTLARQYQAVLGYYGNVSVSDITVLSGYGYSYGVVGSYYGDVSVTDSTIDSAYTYWDVTIGAVGSTLGDVSVTSTNFLNGKIQAVYAPAGNISLEKVGVYDHALDESAVEAALDIKATSSTFEGNSKTDSASPPLGGALYSTRGNVTLEDCTFAKNTATTGYGGAVYAYGDISDKGSTFDSNTAQSGGGIFAETGDIKLESSYFNGNTASWVGGAVTGYALIDATNTTFSGNTAGASGWGGAVFDWYGTVTFDNSVLEKNSAYYGGAFVSYVGDVELRSTYVSGNSAVQGGGATIIIGGNVTCTGDASTMAGFEGNTAPLGGAAILYGETGTLKSDVCDWGTSTSDNTKDDVYTYDAAGSYSSYGSDESFGCSGTGGCS